MDNPFVYGEVAPGDAFVDREDELDRLVADLRRRPEGLPDLAAPLRQVVADPRRRWRSARAPRRAHGRGHRQQLQLLPVVSRRLRAGHRRGRNALVARRAHLAARRDRRHAARRFASRPTPTGSAGFAVAFPAVRTARDVAGSPTKCSRCPAGSPTSASGRVVVALDEFQAIDSFNGGSVEHALRAAVQHQRQVGYVFAGSEPTLMEKMIGPRRPFYKAGPVMRLQKIPADALRATSSSSGSRSRASARGRSRRRRPRSRRPPALRRPAPRARDVGRCARARARSASARAPARDAARACWPSRTSFFEATWQRLTLAQRARPARASCSKTAAAALGRRTRARHRLGGASTVQAALARAAARRTSSRAKTTAGSSSTR